MAVKTRLEQAYGFGQGIYQLSPKPIVAQRAPTPNDKAEIGTIWCDQVGGDAYTLVSVIANQADWVSMSGGTGNFANLTVNPGPTDLTGNLTVRSAVNSGVDINSGTGGVGVATTGRFPVNAGAPSATAISLTASNTIGGIRIASGTNGNTLITTGDNFLTSSADDDTAIHIQASDDDGGISMSAANTTNTFTLLNSGSKQTLTDLTWTVETGTGTIFLGDDNTASTINIGAGATATKTINIGNGITGTNTVIVGSSNSTSSLTLRGGASANIAAVPAVSSTASPGNTVTMNVRVGRATFTGFTTAMGATQDFVITNSLVIANSGVLATVQNLSGGNDGQMTLTSIVTDPAAHTLTINTTNNGTQALDGNVIITFWVIS